MTLLTNKDGILSLDKYQLEKNCFGKEHVKIEFLALYIDQVNYSIQLLSDKNKSDFEIAQVLHKFKSNLKIVGFDQFLEFTKSFEKSIIQKQVPIDPNQLKYYITILKKSIPIVLKTINSIIMK